MLNHQWHFQRDKPAELFVLEIKASRYIGDGKEVSLHPIIWETIESLLGWNVVKRILRIYHKSQAGIGTVLIICYVAIWNQWVWLCKDSLPVQWENTSWTDAHLFMMTSSNGIIFRVTGPLCGEFTGHWWIPLTKASVAELWYFLWSAPWVNGWVNNPEACDLRRHRTHCDVIVMLSARGCKAKCDEVSIQTQPYSLPLLPLETSSVKYHQSVFTKSC